MQAPKLEQLESALRTNLAKLFSCNLVLPLIETNSNFYEIFTFTCGRTEPRCCSDGREVVVRK